MRENFDIILSMITSSSALDAINPNLKFLIAFCKSNPTVTDTEKIKAHLNRHTEADFSDLIKLALQHGILPLVYKNIIALEEQEHNNTALQMFMLQLKPYYIHIVQTNMHMSAELIRLMKLLEENGIEALSFKGPLLAQMAYGDITLRQYADLDILIRKENIYKVDTLMKKEGYIHYIPLSPEQQKRWIKHTHDIGFMHKGKRIYVEMHWSFLDQDYPLQVDLQDFWEETQGVNLNGYPIPTFSHENLLYYLCIHGSVHLWERITWIKDLDMLIRKEDIDWSLLYDRAKESGFEKMVFLGLHLTALLFDTPLPEKTELKIRSFQEIETLSVFILESWQTPHGTFAKTFARLKLFPHTTEQLLYLHKIILKPSSGEYSAIDLPKGLYLGYYLVRPYLLIKKYFSKKEK